MKQLVGVLALQGDFREHVQLLKEHKVQAVEVRNAKELSACSCLIIPGGESTTIGLLLKSTGLGREIKRRVKKGMPLYGTCAGAIIAAKKVLGERRFAPLGLIDIEVKRNDYGRQVDSFESEVEFAGGVKLNGVFIRSPKIRRVGKGVEVLARLGKEPVLVKQGNVIAGAFHPETEKDFFVHKMLLELAN